ncbi:hypothetical protein [Breoghania sp.]|uniref:hypothetical protein n=1 Tax=Breoghania sp. TaxID=2065378 RepID=UPI002AA760AA|nr:hypothetical protein [Breoghania sp.]
MSFAVSRETGKRKISRLFNGETATQALRDSGFGPGRECFGFNKGQFSFVDLIEAATDIAGPVDAVLATWTAAAADMSRIELWLRRNRLRSVAWLVDYSFETRQPKFCAQLRETFGDDCIRTTASHAKFALLNNDDWRVVIQTSMNLNQNKRLENFWIADDADLFNAYAGLVAEVFEIQKPGEGFGEKPKVRRDEFGRLGESRKSSFYDVKKATDLLA